MSKPGAGFTHCAAHCRATTDCSLMVLQSTPCLGWCLGTVSAAALHGRSRRAERYASPEDCMSVYSQPQGRCVSYGT